MDYVKIHLESFKDKFKIPQALESLDKKSSYSSRSMITILCKLLQKERENDRHKPLQVF